MAILKRHTGDLENRFTVFLVDRPPALGAEVYRVPGRDISRQTRWLPHLNDATPNNSAITILYGRAFSITIFLRTSARKISISHGFLFPEGLFTNRSPKKELAKRSQTMGHKTARAGADWRRRFEPYSAHAKRMWLKLSGATEERSESWNRNDKRIFVAQVL